MLECDIGVSKWTQITQDWFQKLYINSDGEPRFSYYYKSKVSEPCVVFELKTKIAKQLGGYVLIEKDLRDTLNFLNECIKIFAQKDRPERGILLKGLTRAISITYGKCFAQADGRKLMLNERIISTQNKKFHKDLIMMRNEYVAHAGVSIHEFCRSIFLLPPEKKYKKGQIVNPIHTHEISQTVISDDFLLNYKQLITEVHEHVNNKILILREKMAESISHVSPEEFYKLAKNKGTKRITLNDKDVSKKDNNMDMSNAK